MWHIDRSNFGLAPTRLTVFSGETNHMNYLGHLLLAGNRPDDLLGNLMGDFVKGPIDGQVPACYEPGVLLHRRVDSYTDSHAAVRAVRRRFPAGSRRFSGIIVDLWFDHLLAVRWDALHDEPLEAFAARVYDLLRARWGELPQRMQQRMEFTIRNDLLVSYRDAETVVRALDGIGQRLRRPVKLGTMAGPLVDGSLDVHDEFAAFLPDLIRFAARERKSMDTDTKVGCKT